MHTSLTKHETRKICEMSMILKNVFQKAHATNVSGSLFCLPWQIRSHICTDGKNTNAYRDLGMGSLLPYLLKHNLDW